MRAIRPDTRYLREQWANRKRQLDLPGGTGGAIIRNLRKNARARITGVTTALPDSAGKTGGMACKDETFCLATTPIW